MSENQTLAQEIYCDLKKTCRRRKRIIFLLSAIIILLAAVLVASPTRAKAAYSGRENASQRIVMKEFTEPECEDFRRLCNFSEEERKVFDMRVKGRSNIEISLALNISEATVDRRVRAVKKKIIKVL